MARVSERVDVDMERVGQFLKEWHELDESEQLRSAIRELHPDLVERLTRNPWFGLGIGHPLVWMVTGIHLPLDVINAMYIDVQESQKKWMREGKWALAAELVATPHRFEWLIDHSAEMGNQTFRQLAPTHWTLTEFPHQVDRVKIIKAFRAAGFMSTSEGDGPEPKRPEKPVRLYRGTSKKVGRKGISWTSQPAKAKWFAGRWGKGPGTVYETVAKPDEVLAIFLHRGEAEYILDTRRLAIQEVADE